MSTEIRRLDEKLSEAQRVLRDGYHDDLSRAIADVRNMLTLASQRPTKITWDAQGRRTVNGELAPEHQPADPSPADPPLETLTAVICVCPLCAAEHQRN